MKMRPARTRRRRFRHRRHWRCRSRWRWRLVGAQGLDNLIRMRPRIHVGVNFEDAPVLIDYVCDSPVKSENWDPIIGAIGLRNFVVRIDQQGKRQIILLRELLMLIRSVNAATE